MINIIISKKDEYTRVICNKLLRIIFKETVVRNKASEKSFYSSLVEFTLDLSIKIAMICERMIVRRKALRG